MILRARCLGLVLLAALAPAAARAETTRSLRAQIPGAAVREFAVENLLGTMRVTAAPSGEEVVVEATVHAETAELASAVRLEQVRGDRGVPTLRLRYPPLDRTLRYSDPTHHDWDGFLAFGDANRERYDGRTYRVSSRHGTLLYADVDVRVPARLAGATFSNLAGKLEASGLEGKLSFHVDSADLHLERLRGQIDLTGSSGDTRASDIAGSWRSEFSSGDCHVTHLEGPSALFHTSSGDVTAQSVVAGRVSAETSSGDFRLVEADVQDLQTRSSSGDVAFDAAGRRLERVRIESSSGDVRLALPRDASFQAEADQSSGDMRVGFSDGERRYRRKELVSYRRGTGGADIRVTTSSGDFTIEPR